MKKFLIILILILITGVSYSATTSTNGYFYLPDVGDSGSGVHSSWIAVQEATDGVIQSNVNARSTSLGLSTALSDETGSDLAVFSNSPIFTNHIDLSTGTDASGIRASGALGKGTLGGVGQTNNERITIDFETVEDEVRITSDSGASDLRLQGLGLVPSKVVADPCGTYDTGAIFYNETSNYHCFCNGAGADIKMNDNSTACF